MHVVGVGELAVVSHGRAGVGQRTAGVLADEDTIEGGTYGYHVVRRNSNPGHGNRHVPWVCHAITFGAVGGDGGAVGDGEVAVPRSLRRVVVVDGTVVVNEGGSFGRVDRSQLQSVRTGIPDTVEQFRRRREVASVGPRIRIRGESCAIDVKGRDGDAALLMMMMMRCLIVRAQMLLVGIGMRVGTLR